MSNVSFFFVFTAVILLQIGTGKDIRWIRNSNWNNVDNWQLNRLPCKGDIASFSKVTPLNGHKPLIYFNTNSTVRKLVLPRNGKIVLKPSITIRLTANESCEVPATTVPIVATGGEVNNFIGVRANKWECPQNWASDDNSSIGFAPCGNDVPVLPIDSAFSYITSNMKNISVMFVLLRSHKPINFDDYGSELIMNLTVKTECRTNPDLCPCIRVDDDDCNIQASTTSSPTTSVISSSSKSPTSQPANVGVTGTISVFNPHTASGPIGPINTAVSRNEGGGSSAAVIGAVVGVVVLLIIIALLIVAIILFLRRKRYIETKHTHLDEDDHVFAMKESGTASFDNPAYDYTSNLHSVDDPMDNPLF